MWYYERDGASVGPVEQIEIERMAVSGAINRSTRVWTDGMQDWTEAEYTELGQFFDETPRPIPAQSTTMPGTAALVGRRGYPGFRDPKRLTKWLKIFLYMNVAAALVAVISGILELQFLTDYRDGLYPTEEAAEAAGLSSDLRQGVIGLFQVAVYLVLAVLVLRWIHRASYNARQLGAVGLNFSPG